MSLAITVPVAGKFSCVVAGKVIGTSKHKDYWEYHYRQGDLRSVRDAGLTKFVRVDAKNDVESVLSADGLRDKSVKDAALPKDSLTEAELWEVSGAIELVNQAASSKATAAAESGANTSAIVTAAGAASGIEGLATGADVTQQASESAGASGERVEGGGEQKPSGKKGRKR